MLWKFLAIHLQSRCSTISYVHNCATFLFKKIFFFSILLKKGFLTSEDTSRAQHRRSQFNHLAKTSYIVPLCRGLLSVRGPAGKHSCNITGERGWKNAADSQSRTFFPLLSSTDWATSCILHCFFFFFPRNCLLILGFLAPRSPFALLLILGKSAWFQFCGIMRESACQERRSEWHSRTVNLTWKA